MIQTRVFVVAPTPTLRAGLRSMLAAVETADLLVVGDAGLSTGPVPEPRLSEADVILVADDELLEETALSVSEDATQSLLLLSEDEGATSRLRTLSLRGWGVVHPDAPSEELGAAVVAVAQGLTVIPKSLADRLLDEPAAAVEELSDPLTARESQVLGLLGGGLSNKMIARELHISEHTVKFHISSLYSKLGASNRAEAVSRGARHGLISL